jgi:hypothetical protein
MAIWAARIEPEPAMSLSGPERSVITPIFTVSAAAGMAKLAAAAINAAQNVLCDVISHSLVMVWPLSWPGLKSVVRAWRGDAAPSVSGR